MREVREWCTNNNIATDISDQDLLNNKKVVEKLNREVLKVNKTLADYENIKKFLFSADSWTVDNGLLSQTLKPKRAMILSNYKSFIESAYRS
jgi:long-chain acyl-CoA synthetase